MIELDLHGLTHERAIFITEKFLIGESRKGSFQASIITGNSSMLQKKVIDEILHEYGFDYQIPASNLGEIIVTYTKL